MDGTKILDALRARRGLIDLLSTKTRDTNEHAAVAQLIILDRYRAKRVGDELRIRGVRFDSRHAIDGYPLVTDPQSDFDGFKAQYTICAHTAALIGDKLVLTTGHGVVPRDLGSTYFLFGRHKDAAFEPKADANKSEWLKVERRSPTGTTQWVRAKRLRAWHNPGRSLGLDWAIIELEEAVSSDITPIPRAAANTSLKDASQIQIVSHPLGLPRKCIEARPVPGGSNALLTDFGSGASGSPVLVDGKLWAVVSGSARFGANDIERDRNLRPVSVRIRPRSDDQAVPQPFTTVDTIRAALAELV